MTWHWFGLRCTGCNSFFRLLDGREKDCIMWISGQDISGVPVVEVVPLVHRQILLNIITVIIIIVSIILNHIGLGGGGGASAPCVFCFVCCCCCCCRNFFLCPALFSRHRSHVYWGLVYLYSTLVHLRSSRLPSAPIRHQGSIIP